MDYGLAKSTFLCFIIVLFLILCSFVVYTTGRFMFYSLLVLFVLVSPLVSAFWSPRLGKRELCASRTFVCLFCACMLLSFFSSSWCRGLAAVCDCGIPWTFLLTFLVPSVTKLINNMLHNDDFMSFLGLIMCLYDKYNFCLLTKEYWLWTCWIR